MEVFVEEPQQKVEEDLSQYMLDGKWRNWILNIIIILNIRPSTHSLGITTYIQMIKSMDVMQVQVFPWNGTTIVYTWTIFLSLVRFYFDFFYLDHICRENRRICQHLLFSLKKTGHHLAILKILFYYYFELHTAPIFLLKSDRRV